MSLRMQAEIGKVAAENWQDGITEGRGGTRFYSKWVNSPPIVRKKRPPEHERPFFLQSRAARGKRGERDRKQVK